MKKWIGGLTLVLLVCGVSVFIGYTVSTHTAQKMIRADGVKTQLSLSVYPDKVYVYVDFLPGDDKGGWQIFVKSCEYVDGFKPFIPPGFGNALYKEYPPDESVYCHIKDDIQKAVLKVLYIDTNGPYWWEDKVYLKQFIDVPLKITYIDEHQHVYKEEYKSIANLCEGAEK